jgi:hypothetical protein
VSVQAVEWYVYHIYDKAMEMPLPPFVANSDREAIRNVVIHCDRTGVPLSDLVLWHYGTYGYTSVLNGEPCVSKFIPSEVRKLDLDGIYRDVDGVKTFSAAKWKDTKEPAF